MLFCPALGTSHVRSWSPSARLFVTPRPPAYIRAFSSFTMDRTLTTFVSHSQWRVAWDVYEENAYKPPFQTSDLSPADKKAAVRALSRAQGRLSYVASKFYLSRGKSAPRNPGR